jgi:uncharacterized protein YraI
VRTARTVCAASLLFVAWQSAFATADGPDYYAVSGVAVGEALSLRAGPSVGAEEIGRIPHDARRLRNLGCQGGATFAEWEGMTEAERRASRKKRWCKVRYRGVDGWVAGWLLKEDSGQP